MLNLIFLGPPGAGKGTVSESLASEFGLVQISTGDLIREQINLGTNLGKKLKSYSEAGKLAPDAVTAKLFELKLKEISKKTGVRGFIFDGFPRNENQAKLLDSILKRNGQTLSGVINIKASSNAIVERLSNRRICSHCKAVYNLKSNPPKKSGICDKDGLKLYQRKDDNPKTIKDRLNVYAKETKPLVDYYSKRKILISYNGNIPIPQSVAAARNLIAKISLARENSIRLTSSRRKIAKKKVIKKTSSIKINRRR